MIHLSSFHPVTVPPVQCLLYGVSWMILVYFHHQTTVSPSVLTDWLHTYWDRCAPVGGQPGDKFLQFHTKGEWGEMRGGGVFVRCCYNTSYWIFVLLVVFYWPVSVAWSSERNFSLYISSSGALRNWPVTRGVNVIRMSSVREQRDSCQADTFATPTEESLNWFYTVATS